MNPEAMSPEQAAESIAATVTAIFEEDAGTDTAQVLCEYLKEYLQPYTQAQRDAAVREYQQKQRLKLLDDLFTRYRLIEELRAEMPVRLRRLFDEWIDEDMPND